MQTLQKNKLPFLVIVLYYKLRLEKSYVYQKNGNLMGFYLPELGDGLIIADNEEAGIELMRLRYSIINKGVSAN